MELGRDAAMEVSKSFPPPVKLEFEKVGSAAVLTCYGICPGPARDMHDSAKRA